MRIQAKNVSIMFIWLAIGQISFFLLDQSSVEPYINSIFFLGVLIITHGLICFYKHGGDFITPTGVFMITSIVIGGFPAIYMLQEIRYDIVFGHWIATYIVFIGQVLIYHLFSNERQSILKCTKELREKSLSRELINWNLKLGAFIVTSGYMISIINYRFSFFIAPSVYISIIIAAVTLFRAGGKGYGLKRIVFLIILFSFYYFFMFSGFGRINIATLCLALIISFNHRTLNKILKRLISIGIGPTIIIASLLRGGSTQDLTGGIGSVISPHYRFGQIIQLYNEGVLDLRWGQTIWAAIVTPIPREIWHTKPWNFNREITYVFRPDLVQYGHSEASVIYAEWFFNFGYIGILIAVLFFGFLLRYLDSSYLTKATNLNWSKLDFMKYVTVIVITSGIIDLYWGGFSTFMARGGTRLLILYFLLIGKMIYLPKLKKI